MAEVVPMWWQTCLASLAHVRRCPNPRSKQSRDVYSYTAGTRTHPLLRMAYCIAHMTGLRCEP
jgi:hypothetical protein